MVTSSGSTADVDLLITTGGLVVRPDGHDRPGRSQRCANIGPGRSGDQPDEPPLAAAIFLHRHSSYDRAGSTKSTSGCVSLRAGDLAFVLTRIVPGEASFVIR